MRPRNESENGNLLHDIWMHTTSLGGTSPRVFLQNVVRSEMGYMVAWACRQSGGMGDEGDEGKDGRGYLAQL